MARQRFVIIFIVCWLASAINGQVVSPLLKVVNNESDKECLEEQNVNLASVDAQLATCLRNAMLSYQHNALANSDTAEVTWDFFCKEKQMLNCMTNYKEKFGVCLDDDKKKLLAEQMSPVIAYFDAVCEDEDKLKHFAVQGTPCVSSKNWGFIQCTNRIVSSSAQTFQGVEYFKDIKRDEVCSNLQDYKNCVVNNFSTCSSDVASKFFDRVMGKMLTESMCSAYVDSPNVNFVS